MFKKAERKKIKLKIGITGPSGSGKTYSALRLARGLVGPKGKIAVGDTENGSASLYSDQFDFDVSEIKPPYTVEKYINIVFTAVEMGYDALILDSITHQWKGEGGILNKKEQMDSRGGNSFTNWGKLTPEQEKFLASILHSEIHLISTIRSKQEYIVETNDKGKQAPRKVGLAPIQREGMEYEFTTVFDVAMNHEAEASKDRTGLFTNRLFQITEKTGEELRDWLESGTLIPKDTPKQSEDPGEFVLDFGINSKMTGKKVKEYGVDFLVQTIEEKLKWYYDNNKRVHPNVLAAKKAVDDFIEQEVDKQTKLDTSEVIP